MLSRRILNPIYHEIHTPARLLLWSVGVIILRGVPGSRYGTVRGSRSLTSEAALHPATIHKARALHSPPRDDSTDCVRERVGGAPRGNDVKTCYGFTAFLRIQRANARSQNVMEPSAGGGFSSRGSSQILFIHPALGAAAAARRGK